jgi:negative regulator of sigma E activity
MHEEHGELLTAFIDGELTRRERIDVLRLLNKSSDARGMLWQLQQNSLAVKQLPAKTLPADFSSKIVDIVAKMETPPAATEAPAPASMPTPASAVRFGPKAAIRLAWAAGLLLAVAGGLFYFFYEPDPQQIVKSDEPPPPVVVTTPKDEPKIEPKVTPKDDPKPFDGRFVFAELKQPAQRALFEKELTKARSVRVDLIVKNSFKALERLGSKLKFDVKKTKEKEHRIFVENLAPADVAGFLGELAEKDKGIFADMQIRPMSSKDQVELCAVLGIDQTELANPKIKVPDVIPIPDKDKKDSSSPAVKSLQIPDRPALLLTRADAAQIRNFIGQRRLLKPGTVQVLFVISTAA